MSPGHPAPLSRLKDGRQWRIGTAADVAWINNATETGLSITSAIPPIFEAYATIVVPEDAERARSQHDRTIIRLLSDSSADDMWWLGYLDTSGADDLVFPDAPKIDLYAGWSYVLVEAGPKEAASWRAEANSWRGDLPDLMFPSSRSWLISRLWDDEWWCLGGSTELIERFLREPSLESRQVTPDQDATPPGHIAR